jgi:hypothetical protein
LTKTIKNQSFTGKKEVVDRLLENPNYVKILSNPFYLSLYSTFLSRVDCAVYVIRERDLTKYMILKEHFSHCTSLHSEEMREMGMPTKEVLPNLRRLAFEYFHNNLEASETTRDVLALY